MQSRREQGITRERGLKCAFTLLEVLTACAITVLILTLTLRVFSTTTEFWRHSEQRADTFREARAALDLMARDLRMTFSAPDDPNSPGIPMLKIDYETKEEDRVYEEIYAFTAIPNAGKSNLCAVGYRCVWDAEARCYSLRRVFKNSDMIFDALKNTPAGSLPDFSKFYAQDDALTEEAARYIWDLTFRPCENGEAAAAYPEKSYSENLPLWVEIRFKALGPTAAKRLANLPVTRETWRKPEDPLYATHILPFQQQFSMRVRLYAANPE